MSDEIVEKFHPTNGRLVGVIGLLLVLAVVVVGVLEGIPLWGLGLAGLVGVLTWAALLRPGVSLVGDELELRTMFLTQGVPLAAIEEVAVRRVLAVRAGERRFISPAISRTMRQTMRPKKQEPDPLTSYPDFVEQKIRFAAGDRRDRLGIRIGSPEHASLAERVRTEPAWPEIAALVLSLLVLVIGAVLTR